MVFGAINNGTNASKLTSANLSKSPYMIHLNTPINFVSERETPNAYAIRSAAKITLSTLFQC